MRARPIGILKRARLARTRFFGVCLLAGLFIVVWAARPGERVSLAQATQQQTIPPQDTQQQDMQQPDDSDTPSRKFPAQVNPAAPNAVLETPPTGNPAAGPSAQPAAPGQPTALNQPTATVQPTGAMAMQPTAPVAPPDLSDPRQKEIFDETASLVKLANSLKAEVDKTSADTLSVAVVRHAEEIEKLAHKMRTK